jgi:rSAM/selenodomain-associated transferase 1
VQDILEQTTLVKAQSNGNQAQKNALLVVAKRPAAGQTKTRLSPPLSPEQAAFVYEGFLLDTLAIIRQVPGICPVLAYLPAGGRDYFTALAPDFETIFQQGESLGERLDSCLTSYLQRGFHSAAIMNSDTPTIPAGYLSAAFQKLEQDADVVIGPCDDGGYYLIGMRSPATAALLEGVPMSTDDVLRRLAQRAIELGLSTGFVEPTFDVDEVADLEPLTRLALERDDLLATRLALRAVGLNPTMRDSNQLVLSGNEADR